MLTIIRVKIERFMKSLDMNVTVKKRELILAIASCTLLGIVIGALFSPRKSTVIGSYNSADHYNYSDKDDEEEE